LRFWDASAAVPLLVREPSTDDANNLLRSDSQMVVWWATRSECISALARRGRDGSLSPLAQAQARVRLYRLSQSWTEVQPTLRLRALAETLLDRHPLRTADAYQLAAALEWVEGNPRGERFVCFDRRLRPAAEVEGFDVLP
jgi:predicted nucleic acid-binding protein